MVVKKAGGKIYGAVLTSAEKKAMNMEIERQLAEYTRKHEVELNAMILYVLHEQLGFGEQRLKKFFDRFSVEIRRPHQILRDGRGGRRLALHQKAA